MKVAKQNFKLWSGMVFDDANLQVSNGQTTTVRTGKRVFSPMNSVATNFEDAMLVFNWHKRIGLNPKFVKLKGV